MCSNWIDLELFYSRVATLAFVHCALRIACVFYTKRWSNFGMCDKVQLLCTFNFCILDTSQRQVTHKLYNK